MRMFAAALISFALLQSASARDISITLNEEEQRLLYQVLDTATKAGGIETAKTTIYFLQKIAAQVNAPPPAPKAAPATPAPSE